MLECLISAVFLDDVAHASKFVPLLCVSRLHAKVVSSKWDIHHIEDETSEGLS